MISKVKSVQGAGTWESKFGLMYSFEYTMEDGATFKANHKTDKSFNVGEVCEYEITRKHEMGDSGKIGKPKEQSQTPGTPAYDNRQASIVAQFCFREANLILLNRGFNGQNNQDFVDEMSDVALLISAKVKEVEQAISKS